MKTVSMLAAFALLTGTAPPDSVAQLRVCQSWHDTGQAGYDATILWGAHGQLPPHIVIGALDTSGVVWVQSPRVTARRAEERVSFNVSDRSSYGLDFSVFGLSEKAFQAYRARCAAPRFSCYFAEDGEGVTALSNAVLIESPDDAPVCDRRRT